MAKIKTYDANIRSSLVGVPSPDTSGEELGQGVYKAASAIYDIQKKQTDLLNEATLVKTRVGYDADLTTASMQIRRDNADDPDKAVQLIQDKQFEIVSKYKDTLNDPDLRTRFDAMAYESNQQELVRSKTWALEQKGALVQQRTIDSFNDTAHYLNTTEDFNQLFNKSFLSDDIDPNKLASRKLVYQAFGGLAEGEKGIHMANKANFTGYFLGQLSRGRGFEALQELQDPRVAKLAGVSPQDVATMRTKALRVADATRSNASAATLATFVGDNAKLFDDVMQGKKSLTDISEASNALSFQIVNKKAEVAEGRADISELQTMEKQQRILELLQDARMTRDRAFSVTDEGVTAEMGAKFNGLFSKDKKQNPSIIGKLDSVFQFQQELLEKRNQIDPAKFDQWARFAEVAFQDEVTGVTKRAGLGTRKTWFGLGATGIDKTDKLSANGKIRGAMENVVERTMNDKNLRVPEGDRQSFAYETLRFFMDDLEEAVDIKNPETMSLVGQDKINEMVGRAQQKAQLKRLGYPVHLKTKDPVLVNGYNYMITGFDNDGMPVVGIGQ